MPLVHSVNLMFHAKIRVTTIRSFKLLVKTRISVSVLLYVFMSHDASCPPLSRLFHVSCLTMSRLCKRRCTAANGPRNRTYAGIAYYVIGWVLKDFHNNLTIYLPFCIIQVAIKSQTYHHHQPVDVHCLTKPSYRIQRRDLP